MSKAWFFLVVLVLSSLCFSSEVQDPVFQTDTRITESTSQNISLTHHFTEFHAEGNPDVLVENLLEGRTASLTVGKPILPASIEVVVVHPSKGLSLDVQYESPQVIQSNDYPPICTPQMVDAEAENPPEHFQTETFTGVYPPKVAEMSDPFIMRGVRMVKITTYPVRYDFDNNRYLVYDRIDTDIRYTNDAPLNPVEHPIRRHTSQHFLKFIRDFAINGDEIGRDNPDIENTQEYLGHYLVAIHENCLPYVVPFIEWRRKSGWKVDILNVSADQAANAGVVKNAALDIYEDYVNNDEEPYDHLLLIGDLHSYLNHPPNPQWILGTFGGGHSDWDYGCLDGNDHYADVAVSRWCAGNEDLLRLFTHRTLSYEATPDMDDPEWMDRAAVYAQKWARNYHVSLHTNARWGRAALESKNFAEVRVEENMDQHDGGGGIVGPFIRDRYNEGCSVMIGRAENYYFRNALQGVQANTVFPIDIYLGGHQEHSCWNLLRSGTMENPMGSVANTCAWGNPQTVHMSIVWLEQCSGFIMHDMTFGWARVKGTVGPELYIPNFENIASYVRRDLQYYGDPGIQYWNGIPGEVRSRFDLTMIPTDKYLQVEVTTPGGDPVEGAQVTFYMPGEMPEALGNAGDDEYADYDDMFMKTMKSDEDGLAVFIFDDDVEFEGDEAFVTITGRDILPNFGEIRLRDHVESVDVDVYDLNQIEGNDDGDINPGEVFDLEIIAINTDNNEEILDVSATVSTSSPWLEIIGNDELRFGDIAAGEQGAADELIRFRIHPACPDGESRPSTKPIITIEFQSGEESWISGIPLLVNSPNFTFHRVLGGDDIEYDARDLDIYIRNIGSQDSPPLNARLESVDRNVTVIIEDAVYDPISVNRYRRPEGNPFRAAASQLAIPDTYQNMRLILASEEGFVDTTYFELLFEEDRRDLPIGPDDYGYLCFDDEDDDWDAAPEYDWFEICPDDNEWEERGDEIDFDGNSPHNIGETRVVDLPFETQFYGQVYDQITVATNGFISVGDQTWVTNFQNWPLDRAFGGGIGMIAPFWDNLEIGDGGGVYTYYNEDNATFVIEWYKMRHRFGQNELITFQVILQDREFWITETGDQNITFMYKEITNIQGEGGHWTATVPYASIGISSPSGTTGLNYSFNNLYPEEAAEIQNRRAIMFTTAPSYRSGVIYGTVVDAEDGSPIENAFVATHLGFSAQSDEDGRYFISHALANVDFEIRCEAQGYNDSLKFDLMVEEDDSLEVNFELLHPEFIPSQEEFRTELQTDEQSHSEFAIENAGNGILEWFTSKRLRGNANLQPWDLREELPLGDVLDDSRLQGVLFVNDHFYIAGANNRDPIIYVLNRDLELIDQFDQGLAGEYGIKDMTFDGELIWGSGDDFVFAYNLLGERVVEFDGPWNPNNNLAWDSDRNLLWVSSTTSNITAIDREGNEIRTLDRKNLRQYGISYYPQDTEGYNLYIYHQDPDIGDHLITKMNPDNGDTLFVMGLDQRDGRPIAAEASNEFDIFSWVFLALVNDGGSDRLDIWQLDARRDWFDIEPESGELEPDEVAECSVLLNANSLPIDEVFEAEIVFRHNADDGEFVLPVAVEVIGGRRNLEVDLAPGWNLCSFNIVPIADNFIDLLAPLTDNNILGMVKDEMGRFYHPAENFNNIPHWDTERGYMIYAYDEMQWIVLGDVIDAAAPIELHEGWNMISYYPRFNLDPATALSNIEDDLIIVKNGAGEFYLPEFNFSIMPNMRESQGYQVKVESDTELIYNLDIEDDIQLAERDVREVFGSWHFGVPATTDRNVSVLLFMDQSRNGNEVSIVDGNGVIRGRGRVNNLGLCGLALWFDGEQIEYDKLTYHVWDGKKEQPISLNPRSHPYDKRDILIADAHVASDVSPVEFGIHDIWPNPANGPVVIRFGMNDPGAVRLVIYDISGRIIHNWSHTYSVRGIYNCTWNTDAYPSGVYITELSSELRNDKAKITVLK